MEYTIKNVIYCIKWRQKGLYWTDRGSTKNRMSVLRQQINNPETRQISLSGHLDDCSKDNNKFTGIPFYKVKRESDDEDTRKLWRPISFQN